MSTQLEELKKEILAKVQDYAALAARPHSFVPGSSTVPYAGRVFDHAEVVAGVSSMLDFWLTLGPEGDAFEKQLATYLSVSDSVLANSGSSANLLAISSLTSYKLKERRIQPGDEVITAAAGFPTTVAPIIQNGAIPVFVDVDPLTANLKVNQLALAYRPGKTKAVFLAHTLGNPFDLSAVRSFCAEKDLWLVEDNCDALGSLYAGQPTGSFGDLSTQSFYPPHHITLGEGGAVNVRDDKMLARCVRSFRDWGRDCWCDSGKDDTCHNRFGYKLGDLPAGYDHKYIYTHLGYNLKPIDPQAAIGRMQLRKLPSFVNSRQFNWHYLRSALADCEEYFDFMLPTHARSWSPSGFTWEAGVPHVDPSWFGFMLLRKPTAPFTRNDLAIALDKARIGNRMLFGGNLAKQPAFVRLLEESQGQAFRIVGDLHGSDRLMNDAIFVGVYPGLTEEMLAYIAATIKSVVQR